MNKKKTNIINIYIISFIGAAAETNDEMYALVARIQEENETTALRSDQ